MVVDVHCHLMHRSFENRISEIISRAKEAGLKKIIVSGVNPPTNRQALELAELDPIFEVSLGIHPLDVSGIVTESAGLAISEKIDFDEEFEFIKTKKDKIVALGEFGLDFKYPLTQEKITLQKEIFLKFLDLAEKIKKPVILHSRKAEKEVLDILPSFKLKVCLHCFTGRKSLILRAASAGYYFSIPPIIQRLQHFQMLVSEVGIEQILTETDSPWLAPFLSLINEPANVKFAIEKIAEIKKISSEALSKKIWENFEKIFVH